MLRRPGPAWLGEDPPQRVAIVRATRLGDLLCATPMLRALRRQWPTTRVTLVGLPWARTLVERLPRYLDDFLEFPGWPGIPEQEPDDKALVAFTTEARSRDFDLAIQAHGDGRHINGFLAQLGARHEAGFHPVGSAAPGPGFIPYPDDRPEPMRLLALAAHLGALDLDPRLEFPVTDADRTEASQLREALRIEGRAYACLHPGGSDATRRWSPGGFARIADELAEAGLEVVLTGTSIEDELAREVQRQARHRPRLAVGWTSLGGLAALVADARLLVTNDTGISHLAAALAVPSVVVFTGSDRNRWAPLAGRRHVAVGPGRPDKSDRDGPRVIDVGAWPGPQTGDVLEAVRRQLARERTPRHEEARA